MPGLLDRRLAGLDLLYADLYQPDIIHEAASSPDVKGRRVLAILVAAKAPPEELLAPPFLAAVGLRGCHASAFAAAGAVAAQAQEWAGAGAGAGAALCCEANIKAAVVATAAMARMDANPDEEVPVMDQLVSAELLTALCHLGGADLSTPVAVLWECEDAFDFAGHDDCTSMFDFTFGPPALAHQLPLGSWIAIAAARMGLPHLLWAALTWAHTWDDSVAGVDWGPDPGIGGDLVGQQAQDEFEAYMRKVHRIRQNSVLGLALWRQAVIARPANIESEVWAAGLCGRMLMYMRPPLGCAAGRALAMTVIHQPQALQQEQEFMSSLALSLRSGVARLQQLRANGVQVQRQTYAAAFQQNEMFAQSAMDFQQTIALLYADPETVAQEQRSWGVMRGYCQAAPGTSLCAFTEHDVAVAAQYITQNLTQQRWEPKAHVVNSTALLMLRSLRTGLWQFHQRLNEQQVTRLLGVVSAGGTPAVQEGARADALAAARQAAAAVPEGLIATAARACASAALEYGGEMAGAAGWALRRRRCAEAAGSAGGAARAVREVLAGAAVEPLACALAEALIEQRFARMAMTAAAEAFGSTAPAMAAVSAAINLGLHASTFSCACSLLLTQPLPPLIL